MHFSSLLRRLAARGWLFTTSFLVFDVLCGSAGSAFNSIAPQLPPRVLHLANQLLDLENSRRGARDHVHLWIRNSCAEIDRQAQLSSDSSSLTTVFLEWVRRLPPSPHTADWKLSNIAKGNRGSCIALVSGALLVGRSLGLPVAAIAVPDHLLLQVEANGKSRLFDLVEGTKELEPSGASAFYKVLPGSARAFFRPLTDDEIVACVRIELGAELIDSGDLRGAKRELGKAVHGFPSHPSGFYNLGVLELAHQRWDEAGALFTQAIALNPNDARPWYNRAFALWKQDRRSGARLDLKEALRLNPRMKEAVDLKRRLEEDR